MERRLLQRQGGTDAVDPLVGLTAEWLTRYLRSEQPDAALLRRLGNASVRLPRHERRDLVRRIRKSLERYLRQRLGTQLPRQVVSRLAMVALVMVLLGARPQTADASTANITGTTLNYVAAAGEANSLTVTLAAGTFTLTDPAVPITAGAGCAGGGAAGMAVTCANTGVTLINVSLDNLGDTGIINPAINSVMLGGTGDDSLVGGGGSDSLDGGTGNDTLFGAAAGDTLFGGDNNDSLVGGTESDSLDGEDGNDTLSGDAGNDTLTGGEDNDSLVGGIGNDSFSNFQDNADETATTNDTLFGGAGVDSLLGGPGADSLDGGTEGDTLSGDAGSDTLFGNDQNDSLVGGTENDSLAGALGNDTLFGGDGNDRLADGMGDDSLDGALNDDLYALTPGSMDTVNDSSGDDTVDFSLASTGITIDMDLTGSDQVVNGAGDTVRLNGQIENFVGSASANAVTAMPLSVVRSITGGGASDTLTVNGSTVPETFTVTDSQVARTGSGTITYAAIEALNLNTGNEGSQPGDTVDVTAATGAVAMTLDGGLPGSPPGDKLNPAQTAVTPPITAMNFESGPQMLATACSSGLQCMTGFCADAACCDTACGGVMEACNVAGQTGTCTPTLVNGNACADGTQCESTICADGVCCNTTCGGMGSCNLPNSKGICSARHAVPALSPWGLLAVACGMILAGWRRLSRSKRRA